MVQTGGQASVTPAGPACACTCSRRRRRAQTCGSSSTATRSVSQAGGGIRGCGGSRASPRSLARPASAGLHGLWHALGGQARSQEGLARRVERVLGHELHEECGVHVLQALGHAAHAGVGGQHKLRQRRGASAQRCSSARGRAGIDTRGLVGCSPIPSRPRPIPDPTHHEPPTTPHLTPATPPPHTLSPEGASRKCSL